MELTKNPNKVEGTPLSMPQRGRKKKLTPECIAIICEAVTAGSSEMAARIKGGVGAATFYAEKKVNPTFRQALEEARRKWAHTRFLDHRATLEISRRLRAGLRKPKRPEPIPQAKLIAYHLISRVPLYIVSISLKEEQEACTEWNLPFDAWQRQKEAFKLMKKVYEKRAILRGQNLQAMQSQSMKPFLRNQNDFDQNYGVP